MVTKSLAQTPFGKKLIYEIDGECVWSEYLPFSHGKRKRHRNGSDPDRNVLAQIYDGMRSMLQQRKAS